MGKDFALITGPIEGRIPHGDGFLNVTPPVLEFDSEEEAQAAADSIEVEHAMRGSHPVQLAAEAVDAHPDEFPEVTVKDTQNALRALNKKVGL